MARKLVNVACSDPNIGRIRRVFHQLRPAELAAYPGLDGAAVTRYLDQVEETGLIERTPNAADRRSIHINVTTDGQRVVSQGLRSSKATNEKFLAGLSTAEIECFQTAIRAMLAKSDITVAGF